MNVKPKDCILIGIPFHGGYYIHKDRPQPIKEIVFITGKDRHPITGEILDYE